MSDDITAPVPFSKAAEFAVACLRDDPDNFHQPFEFDASRFPQLDAGEYVLIEFRRIRREPFAWELPPAELPVMDAG